MRLAASSGIEITEINVGSRQFSYNNVLIILLNYMLNKLAFSRHIDMYRI